MLNEESLYLIKYKKETLISTSIIAFIFIITVGAQLLFYFLQDKVLLNFQLKIQTIYALTIYLLHTTIFIIASNLY